MLIRLDNFSFSYPKSDFEIFRAANLQLPKGGLYGLIGQNGSGKTTLFHFLNFPNFLPHTGNLVIDCPVHERQVVLQRAWLPNLLNLNELLSFVFNLNSSKADALLEEFHGDLSSHEKERFDKICSRRFGKASTGERQWFSFRLGLFLGRSLILLDEPTNGLDPGSRVEFWKAITRERERGKTIIVSSHLIDEIAEHANGLILIRNKKIELYPTAQSLVEKFGGSSSNEAFLKATKMDFE
jgi:ABC-2 type transport system ATP-binding protein